MKKNIMLLLSTSVIAGCGCGSKAEEQVYSHVTGLPEGPGGNYGADEIGIPVYNYIKAEADMIAGIISTEKYCEVENEIFPKHFTSENSCAESDFVSQYSGVMKNSSPLEKHLLDVVGKQSDTNNIPLAFKDLDVDVDYSNLILDAQFKGSSEDGNKVLVGGMKITQTMTFEEEVYTYNSGLMNVFDYSYNDNYVAHIDVKKPKELTLVWEITDHEIEYNMKSVSDEWIIDSKN